MKLMPSAVSVEPVLVVAMMNANKLSTKCWSKWMALKATKG